ncbi:hypothetical protein PSTG_17111 [Puccinia striiformis f. sp. tritici PST-78]|uniref:Uncharacterized protein n=1 Tax=Puccinia striiformis f. sp. tritici PST-78 TaxID=1165861 RepID=A0A0L0UQR7_9BASI|nr:hypothetical protein PSTG_17111 [Puccinia striiformis f. sp. tritici PST-78]
MAPRKNAQQLAAELELLKDENVHLRNRLDGFEKSMDLAMIQMNTVLQAKPPANAQPLAELTGKLTRLEENAAVSIQLAGKFSELESQCREMDGRMIVETQAVGDLKARVRENEVTLGARLSELESECRGIQGRMKVEAQTVADLQARVANLGENEANRLDAKVVELELKCREVCGRVDMEVRYSLQMLYSMATSIDNHTKCYLLQNNRRLAIQPPNYNSVELCQGEIQALETHLKSIREDMRASQETATENQKELLKHRAEIKNMQNLGKRVSQQITNLELSSRRNQTDLSGQACRIDQVELEGRQSVTRRQDEIDDRLKSIEGIANEFGENLSAAVESVKQWVILVQKEEVGSILEQLNQNSRDIANQRLDLNCLQRIKPQVDQISQDQSKLFDQLKIIDGRTIQLYGENGERQLVHANMQNQSMDLMDTGEGVMDLVQKKCDESVSVMQSSLSARLELFQQTILVAQRNELQPVINQNAQNSSELLQQRRQLQSVLKTKAQIEGKILRLEDANNRNETNLSKTKSVIDSLVQENQLISQRQNNIDDNVSQLSRWNDEAQLRNESMQNESMASLSLFVTSVDYRIGLCVLYLLPISGIVSTYCPGAYSKLCKLANFCDLGSQPDPKDNLTQRQTCKESLQIYQHNSNSALESFKQRLLSAQNKELRSIMGQVKKTSSEITKQSRQLESMESAKAQVSKYQLNTQTNSQSNLSEANPDIQTLLKKTRPIQPHQTTDHPDEAPLDLENLMDIQTSHHLIPDISIDEVSTSSRSGTSKERLGAKSARSNLHGPSGAGYEPDTESDSDEESSDCPDIPERYHSTAPQNNCANFGGRDYTDDESDSSSPRNKASTSRQPNKVQGSLNKNQKWVRATQKNGKQKRQSLRKERESMDPAEVDDDKALSNAVQEHIRILTGLPRKKKAFPRSPTLEELENLPALPEGVLSVSAPAAIKAKKVTATWDRDETMGNNFSTYCLRRARQYGLPFVGLSIFTKNSKALEWNRRTSAFCNDTFYHAVIAGDYGKIFRAGYDLDDGGLKRVEKLIQVNLEYRIAEMTKDFKRANIKSKGCGSDSSDEDGRLRASKLREEDEQKDRRKARVVALAQRRYDTANAFPEMRRYRFLFEDERLCSSDESVAEDDDDTRIRHVPVWRSQKATALVEKIDKLTKILRKQGPRKSGRKPGKGINLGAEAPPGGLEASPCQLPEDCYGTLWMGAQPVEQRKRLAVKPATFDDD